MTESTWLATKEACSRLGMHPVTLKRKRDISGGFLESGNHWRMKFPNSNSVILWNVPAIEKLFHQRGLKALQNEQQG